MRLSRDELKMNCMTMNSKPATRPLPTLCGHGSLTVLLWLRLELFESILSNSFAESQRLTGKADNACRHPTDTATLGTIVSLYFALGQRGINVCASVYLRPVLCVGAPPLPPTPPAFEHKPLLTRAPPVGRFEMGLSCNEAVCEPPSLARHQTDVLVTVHERQDARSW